MRNFLRVSSGLDMTALRLELARQSGLWGQRDYRTTFDHTPHSEIEDIWIRFHQDPRGLDATMAAQGVIWYPEVSLFPSLKGLVLPLMLYTGSCGIERMVFTRLAPGKRIYPHSDNKGEYVHQPDINRYHLVVQGSPGNLFECGGETVAMATGDIWWFNPWLQHECLNDSTEDRIHLLVDLKGWPLESPK